jgi:hypothetical protein
MLRVIGAGLPRTGTSSLRAALRTLLGADCYHMQSLFEDPSRVDDWVAALQGQTPDWDNMFVGHAAAVDWPASAFWSQLAQHYPDAVIVLSKRSDGATWYRSMSDTILRVRREAGSSQHNGDSDTAGDFGVMFGGLWQRIIDTDHDDADSCIAAYDRYIAQVRRTAPAGRLLEWNASQGWQPLCEALDVPVPAEPFPHVNTTAQFHQFAEQARAAVQSQN